MQGIIDGIKNVFNSVGNFFGNVGSGIKNFFGNIGSGIKSLFGFAGGTDNAPAGVALVGEEGPELVRFRGGEQVVPAPDKTDIKRWKLGKRVQRYLQQHAGHDGFRNDEADEGLAEVTGF